MERQNNNNNRPNQPTAGGGQNNSGQGQRRRPPHHHHRKPNQQTEGAPSQTNQQPRRHTGPRPQHNNQNRPNGPRPHDNASRPATTPSAKVIQKYENLLDQHLQMRRKYFEYFDRVSPEERRKLELRFFGTLEQLRRYEDGLESWQKEYLYKKTEIYRPDYTYSSNHEIPPTAEKVDVVGEFDDPHQLVAQKSRPSYKDDAEESEGTYEDYKKLKGLF